MTAPDRAQAEALHRAVPGFVSARVRRVSTGVHGTTTAWRVRVRRGGAERTVEAGTSTEPAPPGAVDVDGTVAWEWPHDPWLPALPDAVSGARVADLLGVPVPRLVLRAYRPGRRAVVEGPSFLKVLRPDRVADVAARHRVLHEAGLPVPAVLQEDPRGLLVLPRLPGRQGREALRAGRPMPSGEALLALLDRLPAELLALPRRASWSDGAVRYAEAVGAVLPDEAARAARVGEAVRAGLAACDPAPQPVHGDLHEAQLLVAARQVTGLLDVDRAGPGRRADDLACLLAHVAQLVASGRVARRRGERLLAGWEAAFAPAVDARELGLRRAGVLLSLATGPHRVQAPDWPAATRRLLDLAEEALPR